MGARHGLDPADQLRDIAATIGAAAHAIRLEIQELEGHGRGPETEQDAYRIGIFYERIEEEAAALRALAADLEGQRNRQAAELA
jgi:hypothetical protein